MATDGTGVALAGRGGLGARGMPLGGAPGSVGAARLSVDRGPCGRMLGGVGRMLGGGGRMLGGGGLVAEKGGLPLASGFERTGGGGGVPGGRDGARASAELGVAGAWAGAGATEARGDDGVAPTPPDGRGGNETGLGACATGAGRGTSTVGAAGSGAGWSLAVPFSSLIVAGSTFHSQHTLSLRKLAPADPWAETFSLSNSDRKRPRGRSSLRESMRRVRRACFGSSLSSAP
ncbi:MAG TPA: hypothetical protein VGI10_11815 [Polyangiaceae bacterium]|jgi:hypothetical protein